ncbi:MAG: LysR family transcriptional regulator [Elusimicrobia bacterium]|nr:LysR family transcriptional regulator [Elusimicrobiota bacterium]
MIDLNALYVFWLARRLGGVGRAARRLGVTQSAVSQKLRTLERRVGSKLYGRERNRFVAFDAGAAILDACGPAFVILDRLAAQSPKRPGRRRRAGPRADVTLLGRGAVLFGSRASSPRAH